MNDTSRIVVSLLSLVLAACNQDGSICGTDSSHCEGETLVECVGSRNNFGTIRRTSCPVACVEDGSFAGCVQSAQPCSPATFQPFCVDNGTFGASVAVCTEVNAASGRAYPLLERSGCAGGSAVSCEGSTLKARACTAGNTCQTLSTSEGAIAYCADPDPYCDPMTFTPECRPDRSSVRCVENPDWAGSFARVNHPAGSAEAAADCP